MRLALFSILCLATLVQAGADSKADLKVMEGSWKAVIVEADGKPPADKEKGIPLKLVVKDSKFTTLYGDKAIMQGVLKLDAGKMPREIDAELTQDPFKGMVQKGLYEVKGDTMRCIFAQPGRERPTAFKTAPGQVMLEYTRLKDKK